MLHLLNFRCGRRGVLEGEAPFRGSLPAGGRLPGAGAESLPPDGHLSPSRQERLSCSDPACQPRARDSMGCLQRRR